jgi:hypothetical protein
MHPRIALTAFKKKNIPQMSYYSAYIFKSTGDLPLYKWVKCDVILQILLQLIVRLCIKCHNRILSFNADILITVNE